MLSGFLVGGLVTARYGYLTAFLTAGGLEILIAVLAAGAVRRITLEAGEPAVEAGGD
jgi:hypothetical protein